jgi:hypothetical protein
MVPSCKAQVESPSFLRAWGHGLSGHDQSQRHLRAEMYNLCNRINLASRAFSVGANGVVSDTIGDYNRAPGIGPGAPFNTQLVGKVIF